MTLLQIIGLIFFLLGTLITPICSYFYFRGIDRMLVDQIDMINPYFGVYKRLNLLLEHDLEIIHNKQRISAIDKKICFCYIMMFVASGINLMVI